jgi:nucleoside-diphosphate kinase
MISTNFFNRYMTLEESQSLYEEHKDKYFYEGLCERMIQGPVIMMELTRRPTGNNKECWEQWRECIGTTDPILADHQSIRHLFGQSAQYNAVHGSDSEESAKRELDIFFK